MATLVSACLLGFPCRPDCKDKRDERVRAALAGEEVVPVCPEVAGGLGVPRLRSWHAAGRIVDEAGRDVTAQFERGAAVAVEAARAFGASRALLKQHSPSCGVSSIGTDRGRAPGEGVAARALREAGVALTSEEAA